MKLIIQIVLLVAILVMGYLVYDSINSRVEFEETAERRREVTIQRLKDIRSAQLAYKDVNGEFAKDFPALINFIKTGQMPIIRAIGSLEDSVAVAEGRVIRDTIMVAVRDTVFKASYEEGRIQPLVIDSLPYIPYSGNPFEMEAGKISRNQVPVQVFYVFAPNKEVFTGLDIKKYNVKPHEGISVGSMTDPITSGSWE